MSYDIHITKGDDWIDEAEPVTLEDVRNIMHVLSDRFRIEESGIISMKNPSGQTITMKVGPYLEYTGDNDEKTRVMFRGGKCPSFQYQGDRQMLAMCSVAEAVGARLMGDEGETYDKQQIEEQLK